MTTSPEKIPCRILVVDDEPLVLEALALTLSRAKDLECEIETATNGEEALRKAATFRPEIVLADFRMPGMTGIDLLARLREQAPTTVRALITGYTDLEIAMEALEKAKIHYYIQKPWNNEELRRTVMEAIRQGGSLRAKEAKL